MGPRPTGPLRLQSAPGFSLTLPRTRRRPAIRAALTEPSELPPSGGPTPPSGPSRCPTDAVSKSSPFGGLSSWPPGCRPSTPDASLTQESPTQGPSTSPEGSCAKQTTSKELVIFFKQSSLNFPASLPMYLTEKLVPEDPNSLPSTLSKASGALHS